MQHQQPQLTLQGLLDAARALLTRLVGKHWEKNRDAEVIILADAGLVVFDVEKLPRRKKRGLHDALRDLARKMGAVFDPNGWTLGLSQPA